MKTRDTIINLLLSTEREGMKAMIDWLVAEGFFESPASSRFHGCYVGGLADHSLAVYNKLQEFTETIDFSKNTGWGVKALKVEPNNIIIATLLHDVCKCGAYVRTKADDGWTNNRDKDKGHAVLSIARIKKFIVLDKLEELMIRYHMGMYGCNDYDPKTGEYPLGNLDDIAEAVYMAPEYKLQSGESGDTKGMSREEKTASQKRRYGKTLRNAVYHNVIVKWMSFADEQATAEAVARGE